MKSTATSVHINFDIAKNKIPDNVPFISKSLNNDSKALTYQSKSSDNRITIPVSEYFPGISLKSLSIKELRWQEVNNFRINADHGEKSHGLLN